MNAKDYYKILSVAEDASADEIKKAFRKIARDSHPDKHPGDTAAEDRFKEAGEAYEILSNPEKRKKYDALRRYGFGEAGFGGGRSGASYPGGVRVEFDSGSLKDMDFADIFGQESPFSDFFSQILQQRGGAGGSHARSRVRRGPGPAGQGPPPPRIHDPFFRQEGLDVHCTVALKAEQLEHGAKIKVRTPGGKKALVRVPANTSTGSVLRLPGQGLVHAGRRGDQYVHVEVAA